MREAHMTVDMTFLEPERGFFIACATRRSIINQI